MTPSDFNFVWGFTIYAALGLGFLVGMGFCMVVDAVGGITHKEH